MKYVTPALLGLLLVVYETGAGQEPQTPEGTLSPRDAKPPLGLPPEAREVQIEQHLNEQVPPDLAFRDDTGKDVRLGDYFGKKPVILVLAYYKCPMLCNQVLNGLLESLRVLQFSSGTDFELVVVSFHPGEKTDIAAAKKASYVAEYGRRAATDGWHFLTGEQPAIDQLCEAVGFRKVYDPQRDEFIHASGIMVLTPQGKVSRYFLGIRYPPRDLRLALVEASENKIGTLADRFVLLCFHYDPASGRYTLTIMNLVRLGGVLIVAALIGFIIWGRPRRRPGGG
jgi:protein SCO1